MSLPQGEHEQEIRAAVVERLRKLRPKSRICHEVNCLYTTRIDLIAVGDEEIIAVEIKSKADKLDRAKDQIAGMDKVANHSILAMHEIHLIEKVTNEHAAHYGKLDGKHYRQDVPDDLNRGRLITWVYPETERGGYSYGRSGTWQEPERKFLTALPSESIGLLWRDELAWLCDKLQISRAKMANMTEMERALRWHANGRELTRGVCAALRRRKFAHADDPIDEPFVMAAE